MSAWWFGVALGQTCDLGAFTTPAATVSVAWVSPVGRRSGARTWLWVVPTRELRAFADDQSQGRTLQWLGLRRRDTEPRRRWKVVVFDALPTDLCRPLDGLPGDDVAGVARCDDRRSPDPGRDQACGKRIDRGTGKPSVDAWRAQWATLATNGFCVLPLERL